MTKEHTDTENNEERLLLVNRCAHFWLIFYTAIIIIICSSPYITCNLVIYSFLQFKIISDFVNIFRVPDDLQKSAYIISLVTIFATAGITISLYSLFNGRFSVFRGIVFGIISYFSGSFAMNTFQRLAPKLE